MPYAVLFPGQGSQAVGMGADSWDDPLYSEASEALGWDLVELCRDGPAEELQRTEKAQPALFVAGYVAWSRADLALPDFVAGHSLGEYTALAVAAALTFTDGLRLVAQRGQAMAAAGDQHPGAMAALLGASIEEAEALCSRRQELWVTNDNAPGQVVVGGSPDDVDWVAGQVRRARKLAVSGAFHTPYMATAADALADAIDNVGLTDATVPVVSNVDAVPRTDAHGLADALKRQLTSRVRFTESVQRMAVDGVDTFWCTGPGDAVAGMVRRIAADAEVKGVAP